MGTSTIFSDYLGEGLAADRPATLDLSPGALGIYFATDTGALSLWNGSAWVAYSGGSVQVANGGTTLGTATTVKADGTTITAALSGGVATFSAAGGGGGSSPYTAPVLADFTVGNQPSGATAADSTVGLALFEPTGLGYYNPQVLWDNTAITPSVPFTAIIGFYTSSINAGGALNGLCVGDGSGKFLTFGALPNSSSEYETWSSYTSRNSSSGYSGILSQRNFITVHYDLTNFYFYLGSEKGPGVLLATVSATAFIGAPTQIGLFNWAPSQNIAMVVFDYEVTYP